MRPLARRGFTLVEMLTVMAALGILAGLSAVALSKLKTRGNFSSATSDFVAGLRAARAEAYARGNNTIMVVDTQGGRWWAVEDVDGNFALGSFNATTPAPTPDRTIASGTLPAGTSFGPAQGLGQALPPPFSGIPTGFVNIVLADGGSGGTADISVDGGSAAPNYKYCSFCDTTTGFGAITFLPSGGARFSGGPLSIGQQISMQTATRLNDGGMVAATGIIDFAIVGATGAAEAVTIR